MSTRIVLRLIVASVLGTVVFLALGGMEFPEAHAARDAPHLQNADATLRVVNDSDQTICHVLISPVIVGEWGDNWLGKGETLPPGGTYSFDLPQGKYDILLADCDENVLLDERGVTLAGPYELRFAGLDPCNILNQEAIALYGQAQYTQALQRFESALGCYREVGDQVGEGTSLGYIGFFYYRRGQYEEALAYYRQALTIRQELNDRTGEGECLHNIGTIYSHLGWYQEALGYLQQVLNIDREVGDQAGEGITLNSIGLTYQYLGRYEQARDYFGQALVILRETGDRIAEGACLNNLGSAYDSLQQYDQARDYYQQALIIWQDFGDRAGEGTTLNNIGTTYDSQGQYERALDDYRQALAIHQEIGNIVGESESLNNIGAASYRLGQYEQALETYQQALSIEQKIGDRKGAAITLNNIGLVHDSLGQYEEALSYLKRAIALIETMRGEMTVEEIKSGFAAEQVYAYDHVIDLLLQVKHHGEAYDYVQRAKARTFLDQLGNVRVDSYTAANPQLVEEEEALRGELRALDASLREEWAKPPAQRSNQALESLTAQLAQQRDAYAQLLTRLKLENPEYASLVAVETLTLTRIQELLADTTLVEYYVLSDTQTLAFVVTADDFHLARLPVSTTSLVQALRDYYSFLNLETAAPPQSLQTLYDLLFAPIADRLHTPRLLVAPHGLLHYVPFAALYDGKRYLVEYHVLSQLPSASILPFSLEKRKTSVGAPLILGDPDGSLPFSRQEAQAIAEQHNVPAYVGQEALEQRVWEQGAEAGILHLSTHGIYDEVSPLFSRLLLAPDATGEHDGYLEVHEVYNLDLHNADLVVLSACQTNLGELSAGDEIVGLNRAFIYAGTPSVLATLWSVEDAATKDLMVAFYTHLQAGEGKASALRQAQLDTMEEYPHPFYWAGFVLTGDSDETGELEAPLPPESLTTPREASHPSTPWFSTLLALVVGLVSIGALGCWGWIRYRRMLARRAVQSRYEALLAAQQRLQSEPETPGRIHAQKQIAQELLEIGREYPQIGKKHGG